MKGVVGSSVDVRQSKKGKKKVCLNRQSAGRMRVMCCCRSGAWLCSARTLAEPARQGGRDHSEERCRGGSSRGSISMRRSADVAQHASSRDQRGVPSWRGVLFRATRPDSGFCSCLSLSCCVHVVLIFPVCNATPHVRCGLVCVWVYVVHGIFCAERIRTACCNYPRFGSGGRGRLGGGPGQGGSWEGRCSIEANCVDAIANVL